MTLLSPAEVVEQVDGRHWRVVSGRLRAAFRTGDFATGLTLVAAVGEEAEAAGHHPDVELRYASVVLTLHSHDVDGLTERDVALAARITAAVDALGVEAGPGAP